MIIRIRELAIQNHNGTYSEIDRLNSQHEVDALLSKLTKLQTILPLTPKISLMALI